MRGGRYERLMPAEDGIIRSEVFPGLWLDPDAMINLHRTALAALHKGLASPEHAAFVARLRAAGAATSAAASARMKSPKHRAIKNCAARSATGFDPAAIADNLISRSRRRSSPAPLSRLIPAHQNTY